MSDAKTYARKLMVVNLSDKANEEKKKEEETVTIDPVSKHRTHCHPLGVDLSVIKIKK